MDRVKVKTGDKFDLTLAENRKMANVSQKLALDKKDPIFLTGTHNVGILIGRILRHILSLYSAPLSATRPWCGAYPDQS